MADGSSVFSIPGSGVLANGNRNSKKRGRAPWNEEIGQASRRTKQAFHKWKIDGLLASFWIFSLSVMY
jgi:hypothetical protein